MSVRNIDLKAEDAAISIAGGTSLNFKVDGVTIPNGLHMVATVDTDYATRRQLTAKIRPSTLDPKTGVYTKDKKSISFAYPFVLDNGQIVFNSIRVERELHPLAPANAGAWLNRAAAQSVVNAGMADFWEVGTFD